MPNKLMNTKEVASYLNIHEKQVYALIKENKIPCTRVTGKWIFPQDLIDKWINESAMGGLNIYQKDTGAAVNNLMTAGSNDPLLKLLDLIKSQLTNHIIVKERITIDVLVFTLKPS